jgi:hypothetical protein
MRLLFASTHGYLDPSSGAALATREILELLAARGADCRVLSTGVLDYERETSLDEVTTTLELPAQRRRVVDGPERTAEVIDMTVPVEGPRATRPATTAGTSPAIWSRSRSPSIAIG